MSEIPTFRDFVPDFIEAHSKNKRPSTQIAHKQIINRTLLHLFGDMALDKISRKHSIALQRYCRELGLAPKTINDHISVLSKFIKVAYDLEILENKVEFGRVTPDAVENKEPLTQSQAKALLAAIDNKDLYTMAYMALHTGMRIGELRALQWKHFKAKDKFKKFTLVAGFSGRTNILTKGKSKELRPVRLNSRLVALIKERPVRGDYVFYDSRFPDTANKPITYYFCHDGGLKLAAKRAGVWVPEFGFHTLRHTFGTEMAKRPGMTAFQLQRIMGHEEVSTTEKYIKIRDDDVHTEDDPLGGMFD